MEGSAQAVVVRGPWSDTELKRDLRRKGKAVWAMPCKLYVPCSLSVKNQFAEIARLNGMTQAELGLVIVEAALSYPVLIDAAVAKQKEKPGDAEGTLVCRRRPGEGQKED